MVDSKRIEKAINEQVTAVTSDIVDGYYESQGEVDEEVYNATESVWQDLGCAYGRFCDISAGEVVQSRTMINALSVLEYCTSEGCEETDSGLWEGLENPFAVILCMAYCALENTVRARIVETEAYENLSEY